MRWEDPKESGGEGGGRGESGWGIHVNPWLIHVNVRQKPLQYCKVISLKLIKINLKKKKKKKESSRKTSISALLTMPKPLTLWIHNKLWEILKETGIPHHLTCLLRNLYAGQEATVRTGCETTDWFQIGKGVRQGCILTPCLFNLYTEYIMRNAGLDETQARIKTARRNINNLRYADDTTFMAESEEEQKSQLMKVKEESEK